MEITILPGLSRPSDPADLGVLLDKKRDCYAAAVAVIVCTSINPKGSGYPPWPSCKDNMKENMMDIRDVKVEKQEGQTGSCYRCEPMSRPLDPTPERWAVTITVWVPLQSDVIKLLDRIDVD